MKWLKTPKGYVFIALLACLGIASIGAHTARGLIIAALAVVVCTGLDTLMSMARGKKRIVPDGALITGLLLALILGTNTPYWVVEVTAVLSILFKHLVTMNKKPVFNPAAVGLLLSVLLFHAGESWWGAFSDMPAWTIGFLLIAGFAVAGRVNKFPLVFAYLGTFMLLLPVLARFDPVVAYDAYRPPFINALLFFGFFMLTDPPTSPAKTADQILFGIVAAAVGAVVYGVVGGLLYLFIGLFAANLCLLVKSRLTRAPAGSRVGRHAA